MVFDMPDCGGCRTCEMACGYHHAEVFHPSISSLRILDKEAGIGYRVMLVEKDSETAKACDGCDELTVPLCIEFCEKEEELRKILDDFLTERDQSSGQEGG